MADARRAALTALMRCRHDGAWPDAVIGTVMDEAGLTGRDRALAAAIVQGVTKYRLLLDYVIAAYSTVKPAKMEPLALDILRLSAFQILFMDKIPPSAAVNEGVRLCRSCGLARVSGLANAVLRRIAENRERPPLPEGNGLFALSVRYSHPEWLVRIALEEFGEDGARRFLELNNTPATLNIQTNTLKITTSELRRRLASAGVETSEHPFLPDCLTASVTGEAARLPEFREGLFYIQDAAARLSVLASGARSGMKVLDACAAPGGKSFACSLLTGSQAEILACDVSESRLRRVDEGARRLGFTNIRTRALSGLDYVPEYDGAFDVVIVDAPCSGLGVIRKKPDIRWKDPAELEPLPEMQGALLDNLSRYVKAGGRLVYSTCTITHRENEDAALAFLRRSAGRFAPKDFTLPGNLRSAGGMLRLLPHVNGTDGFFVAVFSREV